MSRIWFSFFLEKQVVFRTQRLFLALKQVFTPSMCLVKALPMMCLSFGKTAAKACQSSV